MWKTFNSPDPDRRPAPLPPAGAQRRVIRDFEVIVAARRALELERELLGRPLTAPEIDELQERVTSLIHQRFDGQD